ncbi:hypothetical protein FAVG1_06750 [Fusarium avenaceum]|nr:hypothetical protein FAVG1_06750 [Fusarium avenaceum]
MMGFTIKDRLFCETQSLLQQLRGYFYNKLGTGAASQSPPLFFYGAKVLRTQPSRKTNYTFEYHTHGHGQAMDSGYSTWVSDYPTTEAWEPIDDLLVPNTDLTLIAIAPNGVRHSQPNRDPVFGANNPEEGFFLPDQYVSPVACIDKHVICNPNNNKCTPLMDKRGVNRTASEALALNLAQFVAVQRLGLVLLESSTFHDVVWTRTQGFLRAQERIAGSTSLALPSNHWEIEMAALFDDTLANLQYHVMEYVAGSSIPGNYEIIKAWENVDTVDLWDGVPEADKSARPYRDMCYNQRTKETQGTLNFSVLGLSLLLGDGVWEGTTANFPRTVSGDLFEHEVELVSSWSDVWARGSIYTKMLTWAIQGPEAHKLYECARFSEDNIGREKITWHMDRFFGIEFSERNLPGALRRQFHKKAAIDVRFLLISPLIKL